VVKVLLHLVLSSLGDREGLLGQLLSKLSPHVAVSCDNISTDTANVQNPRKLSDEQKATKRFRDSIASSIASMSLTALFKELRESELQAFKLCENTFKTTTEGATQFYEECLERELGRIKSLTSIKRFLTCSP
jgi:hypothetical protein